MADYNYDELYPNRFLKAGLFKRGIATLTITSVVLEEFPDPRAKGGKKKKPVLSFQETDLQLILNRTNGERVRGMFGRYTKDWIGKRVTFIPQTVEAFGEMRPAVRVSGSPDIAQDMSFSVQVGSAAGSVTMKKTAAPRPNGKKPAPVAAPAPSPAAAPAQAPAPEPEPDHDPETGEVFGEPGLGEVGT